LLFVGTELLGSNGAIAVLMFGITLGNARGITRLLRSGEMTLDRTFKKFHAEISFFIRAFFFFYLGTVLTAEIFDMLFFSLVVLGAIILARFLTTKVATVGDRKMKSAGGLIWMMMPRGLASAVLASMPYTKYGIEEAKDFPLIVLTVIVITTVLTTIGIVTFSRSKMKKARAGFTTPTGHMPASHTSPRKL